MGLFWLLVFGVAVTQNAVAAQENSTDDASPPEQGTRGAAEESEVAEDVEELRAQTARVEEDQGAVRDTVQERVSEFNGVQSRIDELETKMDSIAESLRNDIKNMRNTLLSEQDAKFDEILRNFKQRDAGFSNYGETVYNITLNALSSGYRTSRQLINNGVDALQRTTANIDVAEVASQATDFTLSHASNAANVSHTVWMVGSDFAQRKYAEGSVSLQQNLDSFRKVAWGSELAAISKTKVCAALATVGLLECTYATEDTQKWIVEILFAVFSFLCAWLLLWLSSLICGFLCCPKQSKPTKPPKKSLNKKPAKTAAR